MQFKIKVETMYDVCFDHITHRVSWLRHQGLAKYYKKSEPISDNLKPFTEKYSLILAPFQEYNEDLNKLPNGYVKYPMVPKEDLATDFVKETTEHVMNYAPLHTKLIPLMDAINAGIRKAAFALRDQSSKTNINFSQAFLQEKYKLDIYTITYVQMDIRKERNIRVNFIGNNKIFVVPDVWCKFVHYEEKQRAILIFLHDINSLSLNDIPYLCPILDQVPCDFDLWSDDITPIPEDIKKYGHCCKPTSDLIYTLFSMNFGDINTELGLLDLQKIIIQDLPTIQALTLKNEVPKQSLDEI